jgi:hypothetical protein
MLQGSSPAAAFRANIGLTVRFRGLRRVAFPMVALAGALPVSSAFAQDQTAAAAPAMPADVVKLKDGSMYRGAIMELVAGDHVDLRLASGELKRFAMSDVKYAGAAASEVTAPPRAEPPPPERGTEHAAGPAPIRPLVTLEAEAAKVHFVGDSPEIDFHIRTGEATVGGWGWGAHGGFAYGGSVHSFDHICTAPCDVTLPKGRHRLALSQGGRTPIEFNEAIDIEGPSTVRGTYVSYHGTRMGGVVIMVVGGLVGLGVMYAGMARTKQDCSVPSITGSCSNLPDVDMGMVFGGLGIATASTLIGLILVFKHDEATIEVTPMDTALRLPMRVAREGAWMAAPGEGMGLRLRF